MTATLRPAGPEERGGDGVRSRAFQVCVNGRPVGRIALATHALLGPTVGRVVSLGIDGPDRGRGRGTVAMLAAEEVLRGWGCRRVQVRIPVEAAQAGALRLATALGYVERYRTMAKELSPQPPPPPAGAVVRPMDGDDWPRWREAAVAAAAEEWTAAGLPADEAAAQAAADLAGLLPDGLHSEGAALRVLVDGGTPAGWLWVRTGPPGAPDELPWVFLLEVGEAHRGRGHGRTLMLEAERLCALAGAGRVGLKVESGNVPAVRLYTSLGYRSTVHGLDKHLV